MSHYPIRAFNEDGLKEFERVVSAIRNGVLNEIPEELIFDDSYSSSLKPIISIEFVDYNKKKELVPYIAETLNLREEKHSYFNKGMWSWLAAFYFENICPVDGHGKRKVNESAFYVLKDPKDTLNITDIFSPTLQGYMPNLEIHPKYS